MVCSIFKGGRLNPYKVMEETTAYIYLEGGRRLEKTNMILRDSSGYSYIDSYLLHQ